MSTLSYTQKMGFVSNFLWKDIDGEKKREDIVNHKENEMIVYTRQK